MIDPKLLRSSASDVKANLARRGFDFDADAYLSLEEKRKALQVKTEQLQSERNSRSKAIGQAKAQGEDIAPLLADVASLGEKLEAGQGELHAIQSALRDIELGLPNLLHNEVPAGSDDTDNVEIRRWGEKREFDFAARDHIDLGEANGMLDFDAAAKISGARFVVMRDSLARLQRALITFMLDTHIDAHGYQEAYVPYLVHDHALEEVVPSVHDQE